MNYIDYFKNKGIKIFDNIPNGFVKVEKCSAPNGYEWYSNNKSLFNKERIHILIKKENKYE